MTADNDTQEVRTTFRQSVRYGFLVAGAISLVHAVWLFQLEHPLWVWNSLLGLLWVATGRCITTTQSYRDFLGLMLLGFTTMMGYSSWLTWIFGRDAGFHLLQFALLPMVMISGRIRITTKCVLIAILGIYLVVLDFQTSHIADAHLTGVTLLWMRMVNLLFFALLLTALTFQYFRLVTRQQAKLIEQATTDPLTGLFNRRQILELGSLGEQQWFRHAVPYSVVICDLDHFKAINDRFGHDAGDAVLCHAARIFRAGTREADSVGRWGGEEFLLLLPHTNHGEALHLAQRVCQRLEAAPVEINAHTISVTVTMGVSTLHPDESITDAIMRADRALYDGKSAGRNRVISAQC